MIEAYAWLAKHYDWTSPEPDQIYLFGFSRGAYTARSVAGLIAVCGLTKPGAPFTVEWLYERYRERKNRAEPIYELEYIRDAGRRALTVDEDKLLQHSKRVDIHMIGVWDTVVALGIPWTGMSPIGKQAFYFHNPNLSKIHRPAAGCEPGRHARFIATPALDGGGTEHRHDEGTAECERRGVRHTASNAEAGSLGRSIGDQDSGT